MCDETNTASRRATAGYQAQANVDDIRAPEIILAERLKEDLGVDINPQALRVFLRWRWGTVAKLAHKIHGAAS